MTFFFVFNTVVVFDRVNVVQFFYCMIVRSRPLRANETEVKVIRKFRLFRVSPVLCIIDVLRRRG